ncbi:MAG: SLATT domain-containing protein [Chloroflexi bacterium]|nr:SLATT domain-containing protein [Chloroflexota bacterium]
METENKTPILEVAWRKFAQYDDTSVKRTAAFINLRRWITIFGILATLLSILTVFYPTENTFLPAWGGVALKYLLVASPIIASLLAAYTNENFSAGDWLVARAGAEEILKDIYIYRTILQNSPKRREWLEKRLERIQRSVYRGMNGELVMETFKGEVPPAPRFSPGKPGNDNGFSNLSGDEYFKYRLENELNWHIKKVNVKQRERTRLQLLVYISGAIGALLAATGGNWAVWVALTASLTSAFLGWQQLKNLELVVKNYSKVIMELSIISDHWKNLEAEERTQTEVNRMVRATEDVLWSRNVEYIKAMQEALRESSLDEEASLINRIIQEQRESDQRFRKSLEDAVVAQTSQALGETREDLSEQFGEILGTLAEEASSDVVQAELAAMQAALQEFSRQAAQRFGLSNSLNAIQEDYQEVEIGSHTPREVLNQLLARYPKTDEVKG